MHEHVLDYWYAGALDYWENADHDGISLSRAEIVESLRRSIEGRRLRLLDALEPEASFDNVDDMLEWLNDGTLK